MANTWRYDLTDPSRDNIRALVSEPAAADTHFIDRQDYTLNPATNRTARRQRFATGGDAAVRAADGLALFVVLLVVIGRLGLTPHLRAVPARIARAFPLLLRPAARAAGRGAASV